ncbi:MAG TPA: transglutaminase-like domain-containing protein [Methanothrix sp.]|nr:transglutaminase-like domain-containing protein [Methanothrix sp.]
MATGYNWAGDAIVRDTVMLDKRAVIGTSGVYIPTDIRAWLSSTSSAVILTALQEIGIPSAREPGTFDLRAWKIWDYVSNCVQYITDKKSCGLEDFWLFPEETLVLHKGDCEDSSFLLATLLLASGISEHCVRVVLGRVSTPDGAYGHAWVVYQNELGRWCLLESTLDAVPSNLTPADPFIMPGNQYQYQPQFCLNSSHLWSMGATKPQMAEYMKTRGRAHVRQKASKKRVF